MQPCITIFAPAQIRLPKPDRSSLFCLYRQHYYYDLYDYKHTDLLTHNESVVVCVYNAYRDEDVPRNNASIFENTMPPVFPRTKRSQIWPHILTSILYHKIWYKSRWISQYIVIKSINIEKRADQDGQPSNFASQKSKKKGFGNYLPKPILVGVTRLERAIPASQMRCDTSFATPRY